MSCYREISEEIFFSGRITYMYTIVMYDYYVYRILKCFLNTRYCKLLNYNKINHYLQYIEKFLNKNNRDLCTHF